MMTHIAPVIVLSLFFQAFFILADDGPVQYPYDLVDSRWQHSGSRFVCSLKNRVSGLGDVSVTAEAGDRETLSIAPDPFSDNDRQVSVLLSPAPWQPGTDARVIARTRLYQGDPLRVNISALTLMRAFQQGKQLQVRITAHPGKDAVVQITPLDIQPVAEQFYRCMDDLLFLGFEQAEHNTFYYSPGKLRLDSEQTELLRHIADYVLADESIQRITVDTHTDAYGHDLDNRELSKKRGVLIGKHLQRMGIPGEMISLRFHGERYPVVDNTTKAGRDKNRRVEIWLKR